MNFSDAFKHNGMLCRFSPDGLWLANAVQHRLIVRGVSNLIVARLFTCLDAIQHVEWSPDAQFIVCGMFKRGLVQVWSIEQPEWTCKIDEGSAGLVDIRWSPDSRHILTTCDFHLRITVWSLINKSVSYIKHPKSCTNYMDFTSNGKHLAVVERRECKDYVSIFDAVSWQVLKHVDPETEDLEGVRWSPDGNVLCLWESCLSYKVLLFSLDGRCIATYSAYDQALGIKCVAWSPSCQFLAIGSYDEKLRLLNYLTWKAIVELPHPTSITNSAVVMYRESPKTPSSGETAVSLKSSIRSTQYEIIQGGVSVPVVRPDPDKANPRFGVGAASFSSDCRHLVTKNDNMPTALWIWDVPKLKQVALLLQESPIKTVAWDPTQTRLAVCTGTNNLFMWSPSGALSVQIPCESNFLVQDLKWNPNGSSLVLMSRDQMCICFLCIDGSCIQHLTS